MTTTAQETATVAYLRTGAIAGAVSSLIFTAFHQLIISNIWATLPIMLIAGALCGLCAAWTYGVLFSQPTVWSWARYNAVWIVMFVVMGAISEVVFEPITTMGALIEANESPDELYAESWLFVVAYTLGAAVLMTLLWGWGLRRFGSMLLTSVVLVATLGMNVSIIGLVEIPMSSVYLVIELIALIAFLNVVYAAIFWAIERRGFASS